MKRLIAILICGAAATQTVALADNDNPSACGAVLCLAGLIAGGSAGGDCKNYMTDFTNQCQSVGPDTKKGVNDRYGNVQSGP
jgi:hypothetical protein